MKNIEALIDDGDDTTVGRIAGIDCAATAADDCKALAILMRRDGDSLNGLLKRRDKAIGRRYDTGDPIDEINSP